MTKNQYFSQMHEFGNNKSLLNAAKIFAQFSPEIFANYQFRILSSSWFLLSFSSSLFFFFSVLLLLEQWWSLTVFCVSSLTLSWFTLSSLGSGVVGTKSLPEMDDIRIIPFESSHQQQVTELFLHGLSK